MAQISVYDKSETSYTTNGIILPDVVVCEVEEELNGRYTLELTYPIDEKGKWELLIEENVIKADGQLFRIHRTEKDLDHIYVYARHIFYDLLSNFVEDVTISNLNGAAAIDWLLNGTQYAHPYIGTSDVTSTNTAYILRQNPVEALLGEDGICERWDAEIERDNFNIRLWQSLGSNKGAQIKFSKNMIGIVVEGNIDDVATRLMPIGDDGLILPEKYVDSPLIGNYAFPRIKTIELDIGIDDETTEEQAYQQMRDACNTLYSENKIDLPYESITVDMALLENTEEYKRFNNLIKVELGDVVSCTDNPLNLSFEAKVVRVRKDVLSGKNQEVEIGKIKKTLTNKLETVIKNISYELQHTKSDLQQSIENATNLLTSALGGYVLKRAGELLIMDTEDPTTATKVWRWNLNGLGYSDNGINGPYELAMTIDGVINADFIATGTLSASLVKTGVLSSHDNRIWINLDNNSFNFNDQLVWNNGRLEINNPDIIKSGVSYKGTTIGLDRGIRVEFANGGHGQIGDGSILAQHADGSYTVIDGRGIMRQFSIPIFEELPSDTDVIDDFETGNLIDTRVDLEHSEASGAEQREIFDPSNYVSITTEDKNTGTYSLKVTNPNPEAWQADCGWENIAGMDMYLCYDLGWESNIKLALLNYRPTKNTTFQMKYKTINGNNTTAKLYVKDLDYPSAPVQTVNLNSESSWGTATASLTDNHTYQIYVEIKSYWYGTLEEYNENTDEPDPTTVYIDDIIYELDINEPVITGYEEGTKPYNDFTYTRKDELDSSTTEKQISLPDYFRGMNYDVLISPLENNNAPVLLSSNNTIPSFTVSGANTKFIYTIVLNDE